MSSLPELPQLAGRYRLDEVLRRGGGVTTYGGVDAATGAPIVVKAIRVGELDHWKAYDLFRREVETLSALRHPSIPRVYAQLTDEESQSAYLVMERVPGESLDHRLHRGQPMSVDEVVAVLHGVLGVLHYLHSLAPPIIHRDIKPGNIVVGEGRVYLVDFGGVRRFLPWAKGGSTMVGTYGYMAPEQLHGDAVPATDLYSLGATVAALLAGCDAADLPRDGLRIDVARIPAARPPLREILARLCEPDTKARVASAAEAQALLTRAGLGADAASPMVLAATATSPTMPRDPAAAARVVVGPEPLFGFDAGHGGGGRIGPPTDPYWAWRGFLRWSLFGVGSAAALAGITLGLVSSVFAFWKLPFLDDVAVALTVLGTVAFGGGFFVRTRGGQRRRILRLARRQGGRVHLAEVALQTGLPPLRARELMDELTQTGLARADPEVEGLYWVGR